jgi:hypothetical protein
MRVSGRDGAMPNTSPLAADHSASLPKWDSIVVVEIRSLEGVNRGPSPTLALFTLR